MGVAESYARQMKALLPPGRLWRMVASVLADFFLACAQELERIDGRVQDILFESDPRTTNELLPDWENEYGLAASGSIDERRARIVALQLLNQKVRPVDYQQVLAPLLLQDPEDVVIIETSRAQAIALANDREIYRFFVYRDPGLPGTADIAAAQALLDSIEHSYTKGHVIQSLSFLCDDAHSLCDRDRLGV